MTDCADANKLDQTASVPVAFTVVTTVLDRLVVVVAARRCLFGGLLVTVTVVAGKG